MGVRLRGVLVGILLVLPIVGLILLGNNAASDTSDVVPGGVVVDGGIPVPLPAPLPPVVGVDVDVKVDPRPAPPISIVPDPGGTRSAPAPLPPPATTAPPEQEEGARPPGT